MCRSGIVERRTHRRTVRRRSGDWPAQCAPPRRSCGTLPSAGNRPATPDPIPHVHERYYPIFPIVLRNFNQINLKAQSAFWESLQFSSACSFEGHCLARGSWSRSIRYNCRSVCCMQFSSAFYDTASCNLWCTACELFRRIVHPGSFIFRFPYYKFLQKFNK